MALPAPTESGWSEQVNGLSGRASVEFEDLKPGLRHAVYLELRNHSANPVAVTSQPRIRAELFHPGGNPVSTSGLVMSGPTPIAQWAVIPRDAYLGLRVDMQTVGAPARGRGVALLAVGGEAWELGAGQYRLETVFTSGRQEDGPPDQWVGELKLPPVEVVITPQMLAAD